MRERVGNNQSSLCHHPRGERGLLGPLPRWGGPSRVGVFVRGFELDLQRISDVTILPHFEALDKSLFLLPRGALPFLDLLAAKPHGRTNRIAPASKLFMLICGYSTTDYARFLGTSGWGEHGARGGGVSGSVTAVS